MFKPFISIDLYSNEMGSSLRIAIPTKPCYILANSDIEEKGLLTVLSNFFRHNKIDLNKYRFNVLFANRNQMNKLSPIFISNFSLPISKGLTHCKSLHALFSYGNTPHELIDVNGQKINP